MPRIQTYRKGGCCQKGYGRRKMKLHKWASKGRGKQRGGFIFTLGAIGSLIAAGVSAAAPAVASGAISAATAYGVNEAIKAGQRGRGRKLLRRR